MKTTLDEITSRLIEGEEQSSNLKYGLVESNQAEQ